MFRGLTVARLFGIRIVADWSLLIIGWLLVMNLAFGVLPAWHPDWSSARIWLVAAAGAFLFFASILAHELSHALVAKASGINVSQIMLFIFGGVANIEREPPSPGAELKIAIVGPLTSLAIGVGALLVVALTHPDANAEDPMAALASLGPLATLAAWLGPINIVLGLFNLVPGFPLDGGRVLRAIVWRATGSLHKATRAAATGGQVVGGTMILLGMAMSFGVRIPYVGVGLGSGLWFALIGWFVARAAASSWQTLLITEKLHSVPVTLLVRAPETTVEPDATVQQLVARVLPRSSTGIVAVVHEGMCLGVVSRQAAAEIPPADWPVRTVREIMAGVAVPAASDGKTALDVLEKKQLEEVPVVDGGRFLGMVSAREIAKWLAGAQRRLAWESP